MHVAQLQNNGHQPVLERSHVSDLSTASIHSLVDCLQIDSQSKVTVSLPAGTNRMRTIRPAIDLAVRLTQVAPVHLVTLDIAVDTNEVFQKNRIRNFPEELPAISELRTYLPAMTQQRVRAEERMQPVSNSVMETILAMREAVASGSTHFIVPRHSLPLVLRVQRGLEHYSKDLVNKSLKAVAVIQHVADPTLPFTAKQKAWEWTSLFIAESMYRLSSAFYEQQVERKGAIGALSRLVQKVKLRSFEE